MKAFRNILFLGGVLFAFCLCRENLYAIGKKNVKVNWVTTMAEYYQMDSVERAQKPIYMDLYTDWCGWCKVMDKKTFTDDSVAYYLNNYFIPIKLNAETKDEIVWRGTSFKFDERYNVNNFAVFLTSGQLGFPTSVIIDTDNTFDAIPGYLRVRDIEPILKFYRIPKPERKNLDQYMQHFRYTWGR